LVLKYNNNPVFVFTPSTKSHHEQKSTKSGIKNYINSCIYSSEKNFTVYYFTIIKICNSQFKTNIQEALTRD